jgi:chromosome segregation protein
MYISQIEMFGFKSFASRTQLELQPGVTCVVGPNGCGKTNILDALRWVLGEQKSSTLRSDKMENVIFTGSVNRKPMGMSEVTLTIQNNRGVLSSEYSELQITRRLYRNGDSEYLLNRQICRLKDIQDLFMDTGLGPDSYSVIELKMVEDILSDRTDSRRQLFEEAAGVTRFKGRRRAAVSKLDSTRLDMQRIEDILSEVKRNVNSLKRQVGRAQRFQESRSRLLDQEVLLLASEQVYHREHLKPQQEEMHSAKERLRILEQKETELRTELTRSEAELSQMETNYAHQQGELDRIRRSYHEQNSELILQKEQRKHALQTVENAREERSQLEEQLKKSSMRKTELGEEEKLLDTSIADLEKQRASAVARLQEEEQILTQHRQQAEEKRQSLLKMMEELTPVESRISIAESAIEGGQERLQQLGEAVEQLRGNISTGELRGNELQIEHREAEEHYQQAEQSLIIKREELQQATSSLREQERKALEAELDRKSILSRIEFLENLLTEHEGLPGGTKLILQSGIKGVRGTLGDAVNAPPELVPAVEAALGQAASYLLADSSDTIDKARELLMSEQKGQATFVDLSRLSELPVVEVSSVDALVSELECENDLKPLLDYLLGDILFVEGDGVPDGGKPGRYVNALGEMTTERAIRTAGSGSSGEVHTIGKSFQLDRYRVQLEEAEVALTQLNEKHQSAISVERQADSALQEATRLLDERRQLRVDLATDKLRTQESAARFHEMIASHQSEEVKWQERIKQLEQELVVSRGEKASLVSMRETLETNAGDVSRQLGQQESAVSRLREEVQAEHIQLVEEQGNRRTLAAEREELDRFAQEAERQLTNYAGVIERQTVLEKELQVSARETEQKLVALGQKVEQGEEALSANSQELEGKRRAQRELQQRLDGDTTKEAELKERVHVIELEIRESEIRLQNRRESLKEEYDLELEDSKLEEIDPAITRNDVEMIQQEVHNLRELIRRLGPVNLLALDEFEQEQERFSFLEKQRDDLKESEEMLLESIGKINRVASERFEETFKKIQANFEHLFGKLFYDGKARLTLDSGDPLEADVGIYAAPSGKKIQHLSLLSGGEKTLTAIALLFSIYMVKPSPFCILDEVDAPLDDSNITKFNFMIREFTEETQFLIITHNKRTMEYADTMYGVTMAEEGVSSIVSVRFGEETAK